MSRAYCGPSNRRRVYPPVYGDIGPARILFESGAHTPHPPYDVGRDWPASRTDVEGILRPPPPDSIGQQWQLTITDRTTSLWFSATVYCCSFGETRR